ncbi:unnamed protein product [Symbiodinium natans]|uniref:Uncharacterized protein n=1 Tax=Symbiodinium natans TaxID=878477 RepID=A0A812PTG4_9DINO|nr:unnamed protein product [Symbiodinium natans]
MRLGNEAKLLKASLDTHLGPHWHVAVGEALGYACKVRQKAMGVWKLDKCVVVIWKSPGVEVPALPGEAKGAQQAGKKQLKVLEPREVEEGSELQRVIAAMRDELPRLGKDEQAVATALRRRLTADFGTIWHIISGSKFVVETTESCRNKFHVEIGELKVLGFQHEQFSEGLLPHLTLENLIAGLPYLLMIFLCFAYMGLSSLCKEGQPEPEYSVTLQLKRSLCQDEWEASLRSVGVVVLIFSVCYRKMHLLTGKKKSA